MKSERAVALQRAGQSQRNRQEERRAGGSKAATVRKPAWQPLGAGVLLPCRDLQGTCGSFHRGALGAALDPRPRADIRARLKPIEDLLDCQKSVYRALETVLHGGLDLVINGSDLLQQPLCHALISCVKSTGLLPNTLVSGSI